MDDVRFPVLTGRKIPGKDPELAARLRELAEQLDDLADELDDRYEFPLLYGATAVHYGDIVTWGSKYAPEEEG